MVIEWLLRSLAAACVSTAGVLTRGPLHRDSAVRLLLAFGPPASIGEIQP